MNSVSVNLGFLKQSHEKIGFIVYATISDFIRAMISLVLWHYNVGVLWLYFPTHNQNYYS